MSPNRHSYYGKSNIVYYILCMLKINTALTGQNISIDHTKYL